MDNGCNYAITIKFASKDEFHIIKGSVSPLHLSIKVEDLELSGMKIIAVEVNNSSNYSSNTTYQIFYLSPAQSEKVFKMHYGAFNSIGKYESQEDAQSAMAEIVKNIEDNKGLVWRTNISAVNNGNNYLLTVEFGSKDEIHTLKGSDSPVRVFLKTEELKSKGMKIITSEINQSNFASATTYQILYLSSDSVKIKKARN